MMDGDLRARSGRGSRDHKFGNREAEDGYVLLARHETAMSWRLPRVLWGDALCLATVESVGSDGSHGFRTTPLVMRKPYLMTFRQYRVTAAGGYSEPTAAAAERVLHSTRQSPLGCDVTALTTSDETPAPRCPPRLFRRLRHVTAPASSIPLDSALGTDLLREGPVGWTSGHSGLMANR
ncbi:hypothetical protein J6590_039750 [Homalodisca vitripennis]|nr:hypothetical protein J6590_039750 [Homalodisca vitripennis]